MFLDELFESLTKEVFHYTSLSGAYNILKTKQLHLSSSLGTSSENIFSKKGKPFFISFARSRLADYTRANVYSQGVVFNINGDWFNNNYTSAPVDYWERGWANSYNGERTSEMEDRLYHSDPIINLPSQLTKVITSCHILLNENGLDDERYIKYIVPLYALCKKNGIPVYYYDDSKNFMLQKNPADFKKVIEKYKKADKQPIKKYDERNYLTIWQELAYKNKKSELSKRAREKVYYISREGIYRDENVRSLEADIHNNRKSPESNIRVKKMFKHVGATSAKEFIEKIGEKWDKINAG